MIFPFRHFLPEFFSGISPIVATTFTFDNKLFRLVKLRMRLDSSKYWTYAQISLLWELSLEKKPTREIVELVGKSEDAVRMKASELGITLAPIEGLLKEQVAKSRNRYRHKLPFPCIKPRWHRARIMV
jgi:hypothetical protein